MDASAVLDAPGVASLCSGMLSDRCIRRAIAREPEKAELSLLSFSILVLVLLLISFWIVDGGSMFGSSEYCASILCSFCLNHADEQNFT